MLIEFLDFFIEANRGFHPHSLLPFIPPQGGKPLRILEDHTFQKRALWQLGPEWHVREVPEDETENLSFILMGEGSDSCSNKRVSKFHSFS
jgi:hypothetical protein